MPCPGQDKKYISFNPIRSSSVINPVINGDKVSIRVEVELDAMLEEEQCPIQANSQNTKLMENALNRVVEAGIEKLVKRAQTELHSDIFGFGEKVRRADPEYWQKHKKDWNNEFAKASVTIKVQSNIRRSGKVSESIVFPRS